MLAKMSETLVHTHSNESVEERAAVQGVTGMSPIGYLAQVGIATPRTVIAHGVHVDDAELQILRESGSAVTHCPSSNLKLGSGVADVVRLRQARITVGIGADGAACNNELDGFQEVRLATLLARTLRGQGALTAADALVMATRDGARALHMEEETGLARGRTPRRHPRHRQRAARGTRRGSRRADRLRRRFARRARCPDRRNVHRARRRATPLRSDRGPRESRRGATRAAQRAKVA